VTGDQMVAAMNSVGVDGALLVSPFSMYDYDPSYAIEVHNKYLGKFGVIRPFGPESMTSYARLCQSITYSTCRQSNKA
jgi:hypothetical protein